MVLAGGARTLSGRGDAHAAAEDSTHAENRTHESRSERPALGGDEPASRLAAERAERFWSNPC